MSKYSLIGLIAKQSKIIQSFATSGLLISISCYIIIYSKMNITQNIHSSLELRDPNKTQFFMAKCPVRECRICLSGNEQRGNKFISPCQCTGSMRYVHQKCLQEWLQVKVLREIELEQQREVECELCKSAIKVNLQIGRKCNTCAQFKKKIEQRWLLFSVCLLGLAFTLALISYSSIQLHFQIKNGYNSASLIQRIVVIASIVLNILLLVFFSYNLSSYFMQSRAQVRLVFKK